MARRSRETSGAGYYGHGMSIEAFPTTSNSELDKLRDENQQLKEQLQYQQQLLAVWQQQPCTVCQLMGFTDNGTARSYTSDRTLKPSRSSRKGSVDASKTDHTAASLNSGSGTHCCLDKAFRQQQVLIAQLQRQVMVLEVEVSSRDQLALEADAILAEASRRLGALLTLQEQCGKPGPAGSAASRAAPRTTATGRQAAAPAARPGSRPLPSASANAAGPASISASSSVTADEVLQKAQDLFTWCRSSAARLSRARAESAAKCRAGRRSSFTANRATSGGNTSQWDASGDGLSNLQQLQLQYAPAGGNMFLKPGAPLYLSAIAQGQGSATLDAAALHQLIPQLAGLARGLAALAVQLRSIILPAMPWVGAAGEQLTSSTAVLAESAAVAAGQLVEACSVLPAVAGNLSGPAIAAARSGIVQRAAALESAESWGSRGLQESSGAGDEDVQQLLQFDSVDEKLFQELSGLLVAPAKANRGGTAVPGSSSRRATTTGGGSPAKVQQQFGAPLQQACSSLVEKLQQRWRVLWFKQQTLEQQLKFVARCSAEQAKLVSNLTHHVAAALSGALEAAEMHNGLQERRLDAQQLTQQLQRVFLLLQQRPGEVSAGGSAVRALVGLLEQQRDVLDDIPELLMASSAPALRTAALAAVTRAFSEFSSGVHAAQDSTESLCKHLRAAAVDAAADGDA